MLIYMDLCCVQRPADLASNDRIRAEADAVLRIFGFCEAGGAGLVSSEIMEYEAGRSPHPLRRAFVRAVLARAAVVVPLSDAAWALADRLAAVGLGTFDALHLSCATEAAADYFCTCDDQLLRRGRVVHPAPPKVVSPLELVAEVGL